MANSGNTYGISDGRRREEIDVAGFIAQNYTPYDGDGGFLTGLSPKNRLLKDRLDRLLAAEREAGGVLDIDTETVSSLTNYQPGYIDRQHEIIVGLQTDSPLKRGINPFGGIRMVRTSCRAYGYSVSKKVEEEFTYRTTHNDGVFRVYTDEMKSARRCGVITGLPDAYGRGRIIGDYRRVALYGADRLIELKKKDKAAIGRGDMNVETIRLTEELFQQIAFLEKMKQMAQMYGFDISAPAKNAREAVQWLYFAYLGAIKEQNGAAMSLGRVSTFLDIYLERDIKNGTLDELGAQELVDQLVIKLRCARHLRTPEYNELFGGDPMWITESIAGMGGDGRHLVTKTSYRFLNTLYNLGPAPEPNLTVLWSEGLPDNFKRFCAGVTIDTDAIQYENDDLMRPIYGSDYAISCCVSAMRVGKQTQFFGARCNLPKLLLLALNGGIDEATGERIGPEADPVGGEILDYGEVVKRFEHYRRWLCALYVNTMNVIHYMHDKYAYEKTQMALHDTAVKRFMAFGIAGLSVAADSLSAIKHAEVRPLRGENGLITGFDISGDYPQFGNNDDRVDNIASALARDFYEELKKTPTYRNAEHTLSILTITSNVVYGKKTGATPDGRAAGAPFAPGANPMHNRECNGALAAAGSVAKLPYECCRDGISNTFSITPDGLGGSREERILNLIDILNGYFSQNAHHMNVNVIDRQRLLDAIDHPELYPNLTIRVSGYAVDFHKLSRDQQLEVVSRTFHGAI